MLNVRKLRWRRFALPVLAGCLGVFALCRTALSWGIDMSDKQAPRDPATGILIGAETRDLGPDDAPVAVLLVHGFLGGGSNFNDLPERLAAQGRHVRVMRLPGHGTTPRDFENTTADELADAVRSELHALKSRYSKVVLVGHSMGGTLCALVAADEPVDGLVLAAPYFGVTSHWYYGLRPETWTRLTGSFLPWVYKGRTFVQVNRKEAKDKILSYRWVPMQGTRTLMELGRRVNAPGILEKVTCPVLLLHAPGDNAASPEAAATAFERIGASDKRMVWLARSNHHVFWDYDHDEVMDEITGFVGGLAHGPDGPDGVNGASGE